MNAELSAQRTAAANAGNFTGFEMVQLPKPDRFLYIYSVSKRGYPAHTGVFPNLWLRGCGTNERFCLCAEIPDPFHESVEIPESGRRRPEYTPGLYVAMDLVNPANLTGNQDLDTSSTETGMGHNLNPRGVWWSEYPPESVPEIEIAAAEARVLRWQQGLVDSVLQTARSSPKDLQFVLNEDSREALDALGIETDFHKRPKALVPCPNCAEMVAVTAKFHKSEALGGICVMPTTEGWTAAVNSGFKKAEDVPEQFRPKRGPGRPPNAN